MPRYTKFFPILPALVIIFFMSSCDKPQEGPPINLTRDDVIIAISSEPEQGFDPTTGWGHGTAPLIQSTLVTFDASSAIIGDLATSFIPSDNGKTWTFTLREDAFFTDGTQLTARDVVFTLETAKKSQSSLDLSFLSACWQEGDFTVIVKLHTPMSSFLYTLASVGIVPAHLYDANYAENPIGSGPWKLVQWQKGTQIILQANEDYYGAVPKIKKATLVFMGEEASLAAAQAGVVDVALIGAAQAGHEITGMHLAAIDTVDNRGLTLPLSAAEGKMTESGYPIGNDVTCHLAIRQAIAYGVDRAKLALDAVSGFATPAFSEHDGMPWHNPETEIETNLAHAKALLAQDGWQDTNQDGVLEKEGIRAEFTCIYPAGDSTRQAIALATAQQIKEIGIFMHVEGVSWDEIARRMFSDAVLMGWGSATPYTTYLLYHSDNMLQDDFYNPEGYQNEKTDQYLSAALQETNLEQANKLFMLSQWDGETGTAMQGTCPWVWLLNIQHLYYISTHLDIGTQRLHDHGDSWPLLQNLNEWTWIS